MPKLEEGDTKTKFLPEGKPDLMETIDGLIEEGRTAEAPPGPPDEIRSAPEPDPDEPGPPSLSDGAATIDQVPQLPSAPADSEGDMSVTEDDPPPPPV